MQVLAAFLLLAGCQLSASFGVPNRDISGLRPNLRSDELLHQVGDWFGHLKDQIYNKLFGHTTTTPSPMPLSLSAEVLDLDRFQLQRRLKNREWRQLDLSTISFDPSRDWGFRVGNWYFIRKGHRNRDEFERKDADEFDESPPTTRSISTTKAETGGVPLDTGDSKTTRSLATTTEQTTQTVTRLTEQQTDAQTIETSTLIDSSEYSLSEMEKRMEDNETDGGKASARKASAEVLMG